MYATTQKTALESNLKGQQAQAKDQAAQQGFIDNRAIPSKTDNISQMKPHEFALQQQALPSANVYQCAALDQPDSPLQYHRDGNVFQAQTITNGQKIVSQLWVSELWATGTGALVITEGALAIFSASRAKDPYSIIPLFITGGLKCCRGLSMMVMPWLSTEGKAGTAKKVMGHCNNIMRIVEAISGIVAAAGTYENHTKEILAAITAVVKGLRSISHLFEGDNMTHKIINQVIEACEGVLVSIGACFGDFSGPALATGLSKTARGVIAGGVAKHKGKQSTDEEQPHTPTPSTRLLATEGNIKSGPENV